MSFMKHYLSPLADEKANMGKVWSKIRGETIEQQQWKEICAKKVPPVDQAHQKPHIPDLYVQGYGHGVSVVPDLSWPDSYHKRVVFSEFYDIQSRFIVDRVRMRMLQADAVNEVCGIYAALPSAEIKEMHFVQCDTQALDPQMLIAMLETIHTRSQMYDITDSEGALRVDKCRSLGYDGMVHCLFFFQNELIYEQRVNRFAHMEGNHQLNVQRDMRPEYGAVVPVSQSNGFRADGKPVLGEVIHWRNVRRGKQTKYRVYYPEITVEVKSNSLHITPDRKWSDWDLVRCKPDNVSKYLQNVDTDTLTVWCPKVNTTTRDSLALFIINLTSSNTFLTIRRLTFASGDFSRVRFDVFREFLENRKPHLEMIGFDVGCINVQQVRDALNSVYDDGKYRPDEDNMTYRSDIY